MSLCGCSHSNQHTFHYEMEEASRVLQMCPVQSDRDTLQQGTLLISLKVLSSRLWISCVVS